MNEELQQALTALITDSGNFVKAEIPDVLEQVLLFRLVEALWWITIAVVWFVACKRAYAYIRALDPQKNKGHFLLNRHGEVSDGWCATLAIVGGFGSLVFGLALLLEPYAALKVLIAPKVYLIEYAANLAK